MIDLPSREQHWYKCDIGKRVCEWCHCPLGWGPEAVPTEEECSCKCHEGSRLFVGKQLVAT